ncbi:hypothetical protein EYR38_002411 [Pleurotus pulmonarius]|nr:hypothetical protein EYR38_002411 [Pleurotus pulmonarius]
MAIGDASVTYKVREVGQVTKPRTEAKPLGREKRPYRGLSDTNGHLIRMHSHLSTSPTIASHRGASTVQVMAQLPLDKAFLLAAWLESLAYGFFLCLFCGTLLSNSGSGKRNDIHSRVMVGISCVMFIIATWHAAINCFRLLSAFTGHAENPSGAAAGYMGNLRRWDQIMKDTLYATQEILGNAAGIYRCFILWNSDWRVIALPLLLLLGSFGASARQPPDPRRNLTSRASATSLRSIFTSQLNPWIQAFSSIAVAQNIITTALMAFRISRTSARSAQFRTENRLRPIVRILVESAALQLVVEALVWALYSRSENAQYVVLELVTPMVGITFNAIAIRIKLRLISDSADAVALSRSDSVQTIGSAPTRRIKVDIATETEDEAIAKQSYPPLPLDASSVHA